MNSVFSSGDRAAVVQAIGRAGFPQGDAPKIAVLEALPVGYNTPAQLAQVLHEALHLHSAAMVVVIPHRFAAASDALLF